MYGKRKATSPRVTATMYAETSMVMDRVSIRIGKMPR